MAKKLALVNGLPRMVDESASPTIYDESLDIISPVASGSPVTLPNSGFYSGDELEIYLNGQVLDSGADFSFVGTGDNKTQVTFGFELLPPDRLRFRKIRGA